MNKGCDIIIPVWNQPEFTKDCIESIFRNTGYPCRLMIIDNGSNKKTAEYLDSLKDKSSPEVLVIRNENNLGFVKAVNQGLKASDAPYACVMNNDTVAAPRWLENLVDFAESHPDAGLLNPQCDGHGDIPVDIYAGLLEKRNKGKFMEMNQCQGFCMLIKREVIEKIGILDEAFGIGGYDDTDYSMRAHIAGYKCVSVHHSYVYHRQHVSFRAMGDRDKLVSPAQSAYFKKWPRHMRVGLSFSLDEDTKDEKLKDFLKTALRLAREWCWVNIWIFGDKEDNRNRIKKASLDIAMPLHQNIKFNFLNPNFKEANLLVRVMERSFGTKSRKRYDLIIVDDKISSGLLEFFKPLHGVKINLWNSDKAGVENICSRLST